jgi:hypothetical protein
MASVLMNWAMIKEPPKEGGGGGGGGDESEEIEIQVRINKRQCHAEKSRDDDVGK